MEVIVAYADNFHNEYVFPFVHPIMDLCGFSKCNEFVY